MYLQAFRIVFSRLFCEYGDDLLPSMNACPPLANVCIVQPCLPTAGTCPAAPPSRRARGSCWPRTRLRTTRAQLILPRWRVGVATRTKRLQQISIRHPIVSVLLPTSTAFHCQIVFTSVHVRSRSETFFHVLTACVHTFMFRTSA